MRDVECVFFVFFCLFRALGLGGGGSLGGMMGGWVDTYVLCVAGGLERDSVGIYYKMGTRTLRESEVCGLGA